MDLKDKIKNITRYEYMNFMPENYIDAAIAKITDINSVRPQIAFMGMPRGVEFVPFINASIKKSGAKTGWTSGRVYDNNVSIEVKYPGEGSAFYIDQISGFIQSDEGDSGAMVLNKDNNVVGMIIAGNGKMSVINKIDNILRIMNVSLYVQR